MLSHYRLVEKVGEGGMGVVYKALDTKLNRNVALKLLPPHLMSDPERALRFQREAQATAALQHPNIAVIYEVGEHEGTPFIAMEFVKGRSLRAILEDGALSTRDLLRVAVSIADGVAHAHAHGVVHRDLKPDNVLVTADRQVKVLDFGLAKLLDLDVLPEGSDKAVHTEMDTMSGELTRAGQVFGTAAYMSPEQARGAEVDHRSDIFSLGVLLYECAAGKRPFGGKSHIETLHGVLHDEPETLSSLVNELPSEVERIVRKSMEKEPEHRYQHADELANDLRTLQRDLDTGRTTGPRSIPTPAARRRGPPWLVPAAVVAVGMALVATIVWFAQRGRDAGGAASTAARAQLGADAAIAVIGFENLEDAADSDHLGRMLMALVTTDLAESGGLTVVSMPKVLAARQQVAPDAPFTASIAAETARRAEAGMMLVGQVGRVGERLLLTSELIDVTTGQTLGSVQKTADSVDDLFAAAGDIGADVRKRLGNDRDGRDASFNLARSLTASVEAYRSFAAGEVALHQLAFAEAIAQFEVATREDPSFALAYYKQAVALSWMGHSEEALERLDRGAKYIERLPVRWKTVFETYRDFVANKPVEAHDKLVAFLADEPDIPDAYYTLGEIMTHVSAYRDHRKSRQMFEKALEIDPSYRVVLHHLMSDYFAAEDVASARRLLNRMQALNESGTSEAAYRLLAAEGRLDEAIELCEREVARRPEFGWWLPFLYLADEQFARAQQAVDAAFQRDSKLGLTGQFVAARQILRGQLRVATGALRSGLDDLRTGANKLAFPDQLDASIAHVIRASVYHLSGDLDACRGALAEAIAADSLYMPARYVQLRLALESQRLDDARTVVAVVGASRARFPSPRIPVFEALLRAEFELAAGDLEAAASALTEVRSAPPEHRELNLADATEARLRIAMGEFGAAIDAYRRIIQRSERTMSYPVNEWVPAFFEIARLEEQRGDIQNARAHYERFLLHWGDADLSLPSVVEARSRLAALHQSP